MNKKNILIVEDDAVTGMYEKKQLEDLGYHVVHVLHGEDAVGVIFNKTHDVDLILMDIDLGPGIDGTVAAEKILSSYTVPIIFLSSHTEKSIVEKTEAISGYGYVVKNSSLTVLDASIKMAFKLFNAHLELYEKNILLSSVFNSAPAGMFCLDGDGMVTMWTPSAERMFGWTGEEVIGRFNPIVTDEKKDEFFNNHNYVMSGGSILDRDVIRIRRDGSPVHLLLSVAPIKNQNGVILGAIGMCSDITNLKSIEGALQEEILRRKVLFDQAPVGIVVIDPSTAGILESNKTAHEQLGYSKEEFASMTIFDIEALETADEINDHISRVMQDRISTFSTMQRCKDNTLKKVHVTAQNITVQGKSVYYCIWMDLTNIIP